MTTALQFKPDAYNSKEAMALRHAQSAEASKIGAKAEALLRSPQWGYLQYPLLILATASMTFGFSFGLKPESAGMLALGYVGIALLILCLLPSLIYAPSKYRRARALKVADSTAGKQVEAELQQWLQENYGLTGAVEDRTDLLESDSGSRSIPIRLYAVDGGYELMAGASLTTRGDGHFELHGTKSVLDAFSQLPTSPSHS